MTVAVAVVMSADARLTRHYEPDIHDWVSKEDQAYFRPLVDSQEVVIMGRHTYEAIKPYIKLTSAVRRIVITHSPQKYSQDAVKNILEFTDSDPAELVKRLKSQGYKRVLVVGGAPIITRLLLADQIDTLLITVEPQLFGEGDSLLAEEQLDVSLQLIQAEQLNLRGTLLLEYSVNKS